MRGARSILIYERVRSERAIADSKQYTDSVSEQARSVIGWQEVQVRYLPETDLKP